MKLVPMKLVFMSGGAARLESRRFSLRARHLLNGGEHL
jgi:hypothetical protein